MSNVSPPRVLVFGATGFTGRLVVDEARRRGLELVLGGRDARALERMADETGATETRVADAARAETLEGLADGVRVVINCAGPFVRFGEPVLRAAIEAGAHYLDTTGEQAYMERVVDLLSDDAAEHGVTAILAQAFEYALGDCAARLAVEKTPGAETVEVFNRVEGFGTSPGTRRSALEMLRRPALAVVNGRRIAETPGARRARVRFPDEDEDRLGISFGGGEVLSAPGFAPTLRNVRSYLVVPEPALWLLPALLRAAPLVLRLGGLRGIIERRIAAAPAPGDERRDQPWWVLARARAPGGRATRVTVTGFDTYGISAVIAVLGALWLLEGRAKRSGVTTPAQAFDPHAFLDALAPSGVAWRVDP